MPERPRVWRRSSRQAKERPFRAHAGGRAEVVILVALFHVLALVLNPRFDDIGRVAGIRITHPIAEFIEGGDMVTDTKPAVDSYRSIHRDFGFSPRFLPEILPRLVLDIYIAVPGIAGIFENIGISGVAYPYSERKCCPPQNRMRNSPEIWRFRMSP